MTTMPDFQNLSDEEKAALRRRAGRQLMKFVAIKVGVAVAIHVAVRQIVKKMEENEKED